jgi:Caspase domain
LDDKISINAVSVVDGSVSAMVLHTDFASRCPDGEWELLIPSNAPKLTRIHILDRLKTFLVSSVSTMPALIYFAGHGCTHQGKYIFCPSEFMPEMPEATGIPLDLLTSLIEQFGKRDQKLVLILDTCRTQLDGVRAVADRVPPNSTVVYACEHGTPVVEIDGYSDFVRGVLFYTRQAAQSKLDGTTVLPLPDLFKDLQESRPPGGSGRPLHIDVQGQWFDDICLLLQAEPSRTKQRAIECKLLSRPKPPGACGRFRGELLNKISHSIGVTIDPRTVQISQAVPAGMETLQVLLPLTWASRNARILEYVVNEWTYLFTDMVLSIPSLAAQSHLSRVLRQHEFDILRSSDTEAIAVKKLHAVAAKVEFVLTPDDVCQVSLSCLGEEEKRGLERLNGLFFPLVRDLIQMGLDA